jgi:hypothetical protein
LVFMDIDLGGADRWHRARPADPERIECRDRLSYRPWRMQHSDPCEEHATTGLRSQAL